MSLDDARFIQDRDPHRVSDILAAFPRQCREARAMPMGMARIRPATTAMATSSRVSMAPSARRGSHLMITSQFIPRS